MHRIGWEIHYNDGFIYTNASGTWIDAPSSGISIIVECFDNNKKIAHMGMDHYYMNPTPSGTIDAYDAVDASGYTFLVDNTKKTGNWVDDEVWTIIHNRIFET